MNFGFKNKKGNVVMDSSYIWVILLVVVIALPTLYVTLVPIFESFTGDDSVLGDTAKEGVTKFETQLPYIIDTMLAILLGAAFLSVIIASFLLDTHPIFLVVSMILFFCLLYAGVYLSNFAEDYLAGFDIVAQDLPIASFIANNLFIILIMLGVTIFLVLFGKNKVFGQ